MAAGPSSVLKKRDGWILAVCKAVQSGEQLARGGLPGARGPARAQGGRAGSVLPPLPRPPPRATAPPGPGPPLLVLPCAPASPRRRSSVPRWRGGTANLRDHHPRPQFSPSRSSRVCVFISRMGAAG